MLGVVGGLGSVCFVKLLLNLRLWFMRLPKSTVWFQPAVGGLTVGLMGWFLPRGARRRLRLRRHGAERRHCAEARSRLLAVLKIVATADVLLLRQRGRHLRPQPVHRRHDRRAPSAGVAHTLFPGFTASPGAYALVGMGTAFAGIVRTPLTSVIMIFEMTRDYSIIVPLMISNLIGFFVSRNFSGSPSTKRWPIRRASTCQPGNRANHSPATGSRR